MSTEAPVAVPEKSATTILEGAAKSGISRPWRRGFWSLVVTQFQGAFNDNALKFLVIYLVVDMGLAAKTRDSVVLVVGALMILNGIVMQRSNKTGMK
jgi:hypothetical protein